LAIIKRLTVKIILDILKEIRIHGKLKRTRLALYSNLQYGTFQKYLFIMKLLNLLVTVETVDGIFVDSTEVGKKFLATLSEDEK